MAGVEKQDAMLCFPLALQFHEQEIPAQKGPGKGWRPGDSRSPSLSPRLVHRGGGGQLQGICQTVYTSSFSSCSSTGFKAVEASSFHI